MNSILKSLAGDVAAEAVGQTDLQLATGTGVAAVLLPALERQVLVDRHPGPRRPSRARCCGPAPPSAGRQVRSSRWRSAPDRGRRSRRTRRRSTSRPSRPARRTRCLRWRPCPALAAVSSLAAVSRSLGSAAVSSLAAVSCRCAVVVIVAAGGGDETERTDQRCSLAISGHGFLPVVLMPVVAMVLPLLARLSVGRRVRRLFSWRCARDTRTAPVGARCRRRRCTSATRVAAAVAR